MLVSSPEIARRLFYVSGVLLVAAMYHRIEDPAVFGLVAGGFVVFSYFLKRAIDEILRQTPGDKK